MKKSETAYRLFYLIPVVSLLLVLILTGKYLQVVAHNALPGDLLFTVKLISEKDRLDSAPTTQAKIEITEELLTARINDLLKLAKRGECIQLQVADLEVAAKLDPLLKLAQSLPDRSHAAQTLAATAQELRRITDTNIGCTLQVDYRLWHQAYQAAAITLDPNHNWDLSQDIADNSTRMARFTEQVGATAFTDQEQLDLLTELMLTARTKTDLLNSTASPLEKYIILQTNQLIFTHLEQILDHQTLVVISHRPLASTLCQMVPANPECSIEASSATWNTIEARPLLELIEDSTRALRNYLNLIPETFTSTNGTN